MRKWLFFACFVALVAGLSWWLLRRKETTVVNQPAGPTGTGTPVEYNPPTGTVGNDSQEIINPDALPDQIGTDSTSGQTGVTPAPIGFVPGTYSSSVSGTDFLGSSFVTAPFQYNATYNFI
ncbi:hypothetical protein [Fibrella forsythiae]|uniref:Uncharacterized protein n=1 Tax=Fibrella forsythiae TaxID=2817061 RepID=A0ABS3JMI6_9BACT|nr:hypothetical protein [Fibrella forsythiae]MBO0951219.1 hypothetical protein [Fibrella forsythiae]